MLDIFSNLDQAIHKFAIAFVPAFLGIILHEIGHGYMALRQGDLTAKVQGRLTLNPLPHIDPVGLLMFVLTSLSGSFVFGWAKPVPVNVRNFRNPRKGLMLVALAGPLTNVLLAFVFGLLLKALLVFLPPLAYQDSSAYLFALSTLQMGIIINLGLALFNMFPIPPLDGSKVVSWFMPPRMAYTYLSAERYGFVILIVLIASGLLSPIIVPILQASFGFIISLFAIV